MLAAQAAHISSDHTNGVSSLTGVHAGYDTSRVANSAVEPDGVPSSMSNHVISSQPDFVSHPQSQSQSHLPLSADLDGQAQIRFLTKQQVISFPAQEFEPTPIHPKHDSLATHAELSYREPNPVLQDRVPLPTTIPEHSLNEPMPKRTSLGLDEIVKSSKAHRSMMASSGNMSFSITDFDQDNLSSVFSDSLIISDAYDDGKSVDSNAKQRVRNEKQGDESSAVSNKKVYSSNAMYESIDNMNQMSFSNFEESTT